MPLGLLSFLRICQTFANTSLNFIALTDILAQANNIKKNMRFV